MKMEKKLQVHNLRISFRTNNGKVQAVRDISFDLHKGETLAIVGESGSGKSVTSKAILGIQAGNAITEGGEILYDGQDLLKISEDDFYKLRGDKIAMIFQDPLSSLNPIMRIGKQLTEAMLLKGKARQRSCKENFHAKLELLEKFMVESDPAQASEIKEKCSEFRKFEMTHIQLEQSYNEAYEAAEEALEEIKNMLFLIEKSAFTEAKVHIKEVSEFADRAENPYVVTADAGIKEKTKALNTNINQQIKTQNYQELAGKLREIQQILTAAVAKTKPDFFAMGYYFHKNGEEKRPGKVEENNAFYEKYLNENFMDAFVAQAQKGMTDAAAKFRQKRNKAIEALKATKPALSEKPLDENKLRELTASLGKIVSESINPIDIVKDSAACTFPGSMKGFMDTYFTGLRTNGKKQRKYDRQMRRYNRIVAKGKEPDWKVAAASTIDLDLVQQNILRLVHNLTDHYEQLALAKDDSLAKTQQLIDYLKENASGMVLKVTKHAAKNRAYKLMEEVGIPEPRKRYRAYPFQFSGGMRQRIVIAIALAANPDILICDEPTTALDVTIQAQILELINRLKEKRQLSIIFITHDLGVVANMADRIAVMYAGKIVEYGTAEEIFYAPAHPYTWALLSSMPDLDTKDKLEAIPGTPPNMIYPPKGDAFAERNRYAMKIDFERQPPVFPITETHWAATWLLHPNAPKVDPPKAVTDRIAKMKARVGGEANA